MIYNCGLGQAETVWAWCGAGRGRWRVAGAGQVRVGICQPAQGSTRNCQGSVQELGRNSNKELTMFGRTPKGLEQGTGEGTEKRNWINHVEEGQVTGNELEQGTDFNMLRKGQGTHKKLGRN